jgi:hypothetical protein
MAIRGIALCRRKEGVIKERESAMGVIIIIKLEIKYIKKSTQLDP